MSTSSVFRALEARKAAFLAGGAPGDVCFGNSSGDLDSIASSLGVAHLVGGVAVWRFDAADLALRKDAALALAAAGADRAGVFLDEAPAAVRGARLHLTDHNRLDLAGFGDGVASVVDHHRDEGAHVDVAPRDVDDAAGSCCSLVAERVLAAGSGDAALHGLLLAAIAVDCRGFDPNLRGMKFSDRDVSAAHALLDALGAPEADGCRTDAALRARPLPEARRVAGATTVPALAAALVAARHDNAGLDANQLLKLDYKAGAAAGVRAGAASVLTDFADFKRRAGGADGLGAAMRAFAKTRGVDVLYALTAAGGDGSKGLAYVVASDDDAAAAARAEAGLAGPLPPDLAAAPLYVEQGIPTEGFFAAAGAFGDAGGGVRFAPLRAQTSRKTVLPALLRGLGGP